MDESRRALSGDATIPLADVFQMLALSQKEGTLILSDAESRKCIFFGKDGVSLLASGKRRAPKLGHRLMRAGRLTPPQLTEMLEEQRTSGRLFGEIAVGRGMITEDELQQVLYTQIEDELCDCFAWKYSNFEFVEGPPSTELFSHDQPITRLALNVNALLMEALRRRDEWLLIRQRIPDDAAVLAWTEAGEAQREALRADLAYAPAVAIVDGANSVAELLEGMLLSAFDGYRILHALLEKGMIRDLSVEETIALAQRLASEGSMDRALPLFQRVTRLTPDDPVAHEALAPALAGAGKTAEAAEAWRRAAERRLAAKQAAEAVADLRQAVSLSPDAPPLRAMLVEGLLSAGQPNEAYAEAEAFLKGPLAANGAAIVPTLCETILRARPADLLFRCALARALVAAGNADRARAELQTAFQHIAPADPQRLRWVREMIGILPDFTEARDALRRLQMTAGERRRRTLLRVVAPVVFLLLLAVAAAWYGYEIHVQRLFDAALQDAAALRARGQIQEASESLQRARQGVLFTLLHATRLDAEQARIAEAQARRLHEEAARLAGAAAALQDQMRKAAELADTGALTETIAAYQAIADAARKLPPATAGDLESRAKRRIAELQSTLREAQDLKDDAARLEQAGKYAEACRKIAALVQRFPRLPQARDCSFPLHVQSIPSGASIAVDGNDTRKMTPAVVRLPLKGPVRVSLRHAGFEPFETQLTETALGTLQPAVELKKTFAWRRATGGVIEASPVVAGRLVLAGSSDGHVYAVDADNNVLAWEFKETGRGGEIVAPLRADQDVVYVCSTDCHAYAIDIPKGPRILWKYQTSAALRTGPALDPPTNTAFLAGGDRRLHAVDRRTGTAPWTVDLDDVPGEPAVLADLVVVGTASGMLWAVETATRRIRWQFKAGGAISAAPAAAKDLILVGAADGVLYALRARDGGKVWTYQTGGAIGGGATVSGDLVLVGSRDKNLYGLAVTNGQIRWTFSRSGGPILDAPLAHRGVAYVGCDDGALYAIRAEDGQLLWRFATDGPVRTTPVLLGQRIFFGSHDRHLYALDVD